MIEARTSRLDWPDCPRRGSAFALWREIEDAGYRLRRLDDRVHVATAIGSAAHAGDAELYRELARTGSAGDHRRVVRAVEVGVETFTAQAPADDMISLDAITPSRTVAHRQVKALITTYATIIDPGDEPVMVEESLAITIGDVRLRSTPDRFLVSGRLPDLKTGRASKLTSSAQLGGQSLVIRTHKPHLPVTWLGVEDQPRRHPDKITPPRRIEVPQAAAEHQAWSALQQMSREINAFRDSVAAGRPEPDLFPTRPESYLCGERTCPAYGTSYCSAWRLKEAFRADRP